MNIGIYRINFDALLARVLYWWRTPAILIVVLLIAFVGFSSGLIPHFWEQPVELIINADSQATVTVNGMLWPHQMYAGTYRVQAVLPDKRGSWVDITLNATIPLTLTMPIGLAEPRTRSLPAAAPGTHVAHVYYADGAWRVVSEQALPQQDTASNNTSSTPTPQAGQTIAVGKQNVERLATLDAYAGRADQLHRDEQLLEAVYTPLARRGFVEGPGQIEVRGWGEVAATIPVSAPLTLLRFSPNGEMLLAAEALPSGGEQVFLISRQGSRIPVVAVPGHITRLTWRDDGSAVVLHSVQNDRLTLTLVRIVPSLIAASITDLPVADYADSLIPLTWDNTGLLWVAPDRDGVEILWYAPLNSLIPEQRGPLAARAITLLEDGSLRVIQVTEDGVVIGRYRDGLVFGETTAPRIAATDDLRGIWHGSELLLEGGEQVWLLNVDEQQEAGGA